MLEKEGKFNLKRLVAAYSFCLALTYSCLEPAPDICNWLVTARFCVFNEKPHSWYPVSNSSQGRRNREGELQCPPLLVNYAKAPILNPILIVLFA